MLRILKSALVLTMVLALAACNVTAPVSDDETAEDQVQVSKQQIEETEEGSGGTTQPEEETDSEDADRGRGRGNSKK